MFAAFLKAHSLTEMIEKMPGCPFPAFEDRVAWEGIDAQDKADLLAYYESLKDTPYPLLTAVQFMAFVRTGSRKAYEDPYFLRRKKLIASVAHMCVTGTQTALDDVIDGIWCICEESSWVISAHNVNPFPGTVKACDKPLPDIHDRYVDLFAAQTAMILSLTGALVGKQLDGQAPVIRRRMAEEIENRVLTPFMTRDDFWWMGFIRKDLCNWTPWIISNILLAASIQWTDALRFAMMCDRACRMLDTWLAVVPQDGGCDEGTWYYNMAAGSLLDSLMLLERATDGQMTFWQDEKIRNMLSFPLKTRLENGWFVNFADCDARPYLGGERLQCAGEKLGDAALVRMGMDFRGMPSYQVSDVPHFSRLLERLFHPAAQLEKGDIAPRDFWLPDLQLRVYEEGGLILCAKGGHNGESHNHNDVGSFMLYADGEPEIMDVGNMVYTAKTFVDETRYTLFNTRSMNHNLPLIDDCEQRAGRAYCAEEVTCLSNGIALDIAAAYGEDAGVNRCFRTLKLRNGLMLHDEIELAECRPVTWVFMLRHEPKLTDGKIMSGLLEMTWSGQLDVQIEEIPVTDARMAKNYPGSIWRLALTGSAKRTHDETFTIERVKSHE